MARCLSVSLYVRAMMLLCAFPALGSSATVDVPAGGDLQAALNAAMPGDTIQLTPGATYIGNFTLPRFNGDTYVTVRTAGTGADLPPAGARITPDYSPRLAKIGSPDTAPALATSPGAHHWRFETIEFLPNPSGYYDIIVLGHHTQTQVSQLPHHLIFDRVYVHGDPVRGQKRGITLNSGYAEIINSYISDIKTVGQDSQAVAGWNGSGPFLIQNNHLEAAGENVLFGGADPSVPSLVPSDIVIRGNLLTKPLSWRNSRWQVKNGLELKSARRVLIEGNIIENVWAAAQVGFALVITPRNQDGGSPWSVVEDVTVRYNIVRHAGSGINLTGFDDIHVSQRTRRVQFVDNLFYDIDANRWGGDGIFLQIGHSPSDVLVERNTVLHTGNVVMVYGRPVEQFVFRENFMRHNAYGVIGEDHGPGLRTIEAFFTRSVFDLNVLAGGEPRYYPSGNHFPPVEDFLPSFTNAAAEDFTLRPDSQFNRAGRNGGPLGADMTKVRAAVRNVAPEGPSSSTGGVAICRPGRQCSVPYSGSRR